jgi:hypothetical protein
VPTPPSQDPVAVACNSVSLMDSNVQILVHFLTYVDSEVLMGVHLFKIYLTALPVVEDVRGSGRGII